MYAHDRGCDWDTPLGLVDETLANDIDSRVGPHSTDRRFQGHVSWSTAGSSNREGLDELDGSLPTLKSQTRGTVAPRPCNASRYWPGRYAEAYTDCADDLRRRLGQNFIARSFRRSS